MNAHQLYLDDGKPAGAWYCESCKAVCATEDSANRCCTCHYCGKVVVQEPGHGRSSSHNACFHLEVNRRYEEHLKKATEVGSDYTGFVYCEHGGPSDGYAEDVDAMAEWWHEQISDGDLERESYPEFVLACLPDPPDRLDLSDLIDKICEGGYEDIHDDIKVPDGLEDLLKKFNNMNAHLISWRIDHTRKVKMPPLELEPDELDETEKEEVVQPRPDNP